MAQHLPAFPVSQLKLFVLVAELGSYTKAASRAGRTQSALSLTIKQMEHKLGQPLFEPTARTTLTPFGKQCVPFALALIDHHQRAATAMLHLAEGQVGKLSIACVGAAFRILLSDLLPRFAAARPEIGISILDNRSLNVEQAVLSYAADFGLGSRVSRDERLTFRPLFNDTFGVICQKTHAFATRASIKWSELESTSLISSPAHDLLAAVPEAVPLRAARHQASHMVPTITMLQQGLGITVLGNSALSGEHNLCYVPLVEPTVTFQLGLTKLSGRTLPPPAALMEALILAAFPGV